MAQVSGSPDNKSEKLLTVKEVAERLSVGERFVRRLIFENRIAYLKIGGSGPSDRNGHIRIEESAVDAYLEASRVQAVSE